MHPIDVLQLIILFIVIFTMLSTIWRTLWSVPRFTIRVTSESTTYASLSAGGEGKPATPDDIAQAMGVVDRLPLLRIVLSVVGGLTLLLGLLG